MIPSRDETLVRRCLAGRLRIILVAAISILILATSGAAGNPPFRVLLISSYHPGFPTFFPQTEGVRSVLLPRGIDLDIEFMDSKRFGDAGSIGRFGETLAWKLGQVAAHDVVMAADDNALRFVLDRREDLFADTPVVFMGVNDRQLASRAAALPGITGVVEAVSLRETLQLMDSLLPGAERMVALVDATPSGQGDLKSFLDLAPEFPRHRLETLSLADMTFSQYGDSLAALGDESAVLLLSAYVDSTGRRVRFDDGLDFILEHLDRPLFHLWHHGVGDGVLGGVVISHQEQGRTAAALAARILDGESVDAIPLVGESPNITVIDHRVMQRFSLPHEALGGDVVLLNKPTSTLRRYRWQILGTMAFLAFQTGIIMFLVRGNRRLRRAKERLRESEQRYFSLFAGNRSVMLLLDPSDGRVIDANDAACRFYGYTREELTQLVISSINILSPRELEAEMKAVRDSRRNHFFFKHRLAGGEIRDVEIYSGPIVLDGQELLYSIVHDITERRQAELEREHLSKRLQHAEKMEAIGTLAGGIAHDFNNILAVILGHAELLFEGTGHDTALRSGAEAVKKAALKASDLVRQILAFSRRVDTERRCLAPGPLVSDTVRMLRSTLPSSIEIVEEIDDAARAILADPAQLGQIVMNLGTNAFHAMAESGGTLTIGLDNAVLDREQLRQEPRLRGGPYVRLSVRDTGTGIPAKIRGEIFDPYFTTKEVGKGTGMGLAIIHGIVKSYRGFINLESEEGVGTCFEIFLPVADREEEADVADESSLVPGNDENILFIDDEEDLATLAERQLTPLGYRVTATQGSEEALRMFAQQPDAFDLVVTDLTMPDLNGLELTRRLLAIRDDVPVVLATGYCTPDTVKEAQALGIKAVVGKPLRLAELASTVRAVLDGEGFLHPTDRG